jgi:hypothetical protein
LRLIDTETRRIIATADAATTDRISDVAEPLVADLVRRLEEDFALRGRIQSATEPLSIDIGDDHGVRKGQVYSVYIEEPDPILAGTVAGLDPIAELEVIAVEKEYSACIIRSSSDTDLEPRMRVSLVSADTPGVLSRDDK